MNRQPDWERLIPLDEPFDYLRIEAFLDRNGEVDAFVVQYETWLPETNEYPVVTRYDAAHGAPHQDVYDRQGTQIDKKWLHGFGMADALHYAEQDLRRFWRVYKERFLGGRQ